MRYNSIFLHTSLRGPFRHSLVTLLLIVMLLASMLVGSKQVHANNQIYIVIFAGTLRADGGYELGGNYTANHPVAVNAVTSSGGTILSDLSRQISVMIAQSSDPLFTSKLATHSIVQLAAAAPSFKALLSYQEAIDQGLLKLITPPAPNPCLGKEADDRDETTGPQRDPKCSGEDPPDPLEPLQWNMDLIRNKNARLHEAGRSSVWVGVLDTGIDSTHADFSPGSYSNIDPTRGRDFTRIGTPSPYVDNNTHGTSVAGIIGAMYNGVGMVGIAPGVRLIPIKVCDAIGYCYAHAVIDGITYAGDLRLNVINMSFASDDEDFLASTPHKCADDPAQRAFRQGVERAVSYARGQGVVPVAAIGNEAADLSQSPRPGGKCDIVPGQAAGVLGVGALGRDGGLATYSNYGTSAVDIVAPGGNEPPTNECTNSILAPVIGNVYGCGSGTSAAAPHVAGVAALIVSKYGTLESTPQGPRMRMSPGAVEAQLLGTVIDIGVSGDDKCFGKGRLDSLRAVQNTRTAAYATVPTCSHP